MPTDQKGYLQCLLGMLCFTRISLPQPFFVCYQRQECSFLRLIQPKRALQNFTNCNSLSCCACNPVTTQLALQFCINVSDNRYIIHGQLHLILFLDLAQVGLVKSSMASFSAGSCSRSFYICSFNLSHLEKQMIVCPLIKMRKHSSGT